MIVSARIDDLAYINFKISEYDVMKASKQYIDD